MAETKMLVASVVSMGLAILLYGVSVTTWMMFMGESLGGVISPTIDQRIYIYIYIYIYTCHVIYIYIYIYI